MMNTKKRYTQKISKILIATILLLAIALTITGCAILENNKKLSIDDKHNNTSEEPNSPKINNEDNSFNDSNQDENNYEKKKTYAPSLNPAPGCSPYENGFKWEVMKNGKIIDNYKAEYFISFPDPKEYSSVEGITTFRGNNYRNSASYGHVELKEKKFEKVWSSKTGYIDIWTGVGWNGQPAVIKWDKEVRKLMNIFPSKKNKEDLKEVICAALDGRTYFLDLDDGQPTRPPIDIGFPIKGSVTVDPRGYPLLYSGQGINKNGNKVGPMGYRIYSLIDQKELLFINGNDPFALRRWGAFDSVGLVDGKTDTLIECGENGILYKIKLNTNFDRENGTISISPDITKYRYNSPANKKIGTENSPAIYKNLIYFADNGGILQCVDLNTLKPVWLRDVSDDTDSTPVLEEVSDSQVNLYTACEVDIQGKSGYSYIRKLDALTGELLWQKKVKCHYDSYNNGGALATPVVGKNNIKDLVIFNIARTGNNNDGSKLLALDKETGKEVWTIDLKNYCWSSPVDIYTKDGEGYLLVCDSGCNMHLIEGRTGEILDSIFLKSNIEASPVVYNNMIVIGTRGQLIYGIRLK